MPKSIPINLASEPFHRNRPILLASVMAGLALTGLLALEVHLILSERDEMKATRAELSVAEAQLRTLAGEQAKIEGLLRQPENAEVLDRSLLLNTLIRRKAISWARLFADLEQVMPYNVRLVSVRPEVTSQNQVLLQMVVGAQSGEPVLQMLRNLEESPLFGPASVQNWLPPSQNEPLYRYRVSVNYAQKL